MELLKYTQAFLWRILLSRRYTYLGIIVVLSFVSVITLCIFQTNLKTNREQIDVIRQWREITKDDSFDNPSVEFIQDKIDQQRDTRSVHHRNLKETTKTGHIGDKSKTSNERNTGKVQTVNKKAHNPDKDGVQTVNKKAHNPDKDGVQTVNKKAHNPEKDGVQTVNKKAHNPEKDGVQTVNKKAHNPEKDGVQTVNKKAHNPEKDGVQIVNKKEHNPDKDGVQTVNKKAHDPDKDGVQTVNKKAHNPDKDGIQTVNKKEHNPDKDGIQTVNKKAHDPDKDGVQTVNKKEHNREKDILLFEDNSNTSKHKEKKKLDNKPSFENHVKEMDDIPSEIENKDKKQEHYEKESRANAGKEDTPIGQESQHSNIGYRKENEEEKEKQNLIDSLSRLLAKLDDKGIDTDLEQKLFAGVDDGGSKRLPEFDPEEYPQKLDVPKLLTDFAETGVLPEHAINKWAYHPIINPVNVCSESGVQSKVFLLFIVKTKPDNFVKRRSIRKTWADQVRFPNIRTVFSVGVPRSSNTMNRLKTESIRYKDVLLMDYMDSYYNLTLKTISNINWAVAHCSMAEFVVSIDDDIYMATDLLIKHIHDLSQTEADRLYLGYMYKDTMPVRKETSNAYIEKWIISEDEYAFSTYPDYIFGGCIIMSMRTVVEMYTIIPYTKPIVMEDVYVGILASRLGIIPKHTDLVDVYVTYSNTEQFKTLIASHYYKTSHMLRQAWECHLSIVNNDVEKAVFCSFLKEELETLRDKVNSILDWIDLSNDAI